MPAYEDKDFIEVMDEEGNIQPARIPKQWLGTEFAPGMKKAKKGAADRKDEPASSASPTVEVTGQ